MKSTKTITHSDRGRPWLLLLLSVFLLGMMPGRVSAGVDVSQLFTLDGVTVEDVTSSDAAYPWTQVEPDDNVVSSNAGKDNTVSELSLKLTSERNFDLSFHYSVVAQMKDRLIVTVDGIEVVNIGYSNGGDWSYTLTAGTHSLVFRYAKETGSEASFDCARVSKLSATATDAEPAMKGMAGYDKEQQTLTFYYDNALHQYDRVYFVEEKFSGFPVWYTDNTNYYIKSITFDKSFKNFKPTSLANWFNNCYKVESVSGIENIDASQVTDMSYMFRSCNALQQLDVSALDVSNVQNFQSAFSQCWGLATLKLSAFDTSKATDMSNMFYNCSGLSELDLSSFSTSNVTNMKKMFYQCFGLRTIYVTSKFTTASLTNSESMFGYCGQLSGAVSYDSNNVDGAYANTETGYFTYGCKHVDKNDNPLWSAPVYHAASCISSAYNLYTCTVCLDKKVEYLTEEPDPTNHSLVKHEQKKATCINYGMKEYYECSLCHKMFLDAAATQEITDQSSLVLDIDPNGHILEKHEGVDATCNSTGRKDYYECTQCYRKFFDAEGKQYVENMDELVIEPDSTKHVLLKNDPTEPSCATDGNKLFYGCRECGRMFYDEAATQLVRQYSDVYILRLGHVLNDEGCCQRCGLKAMTLNGVTADLPGIANTDWDIINAGEGEAAFYGLHTTYTGDQTISLALTSDKDFMLKFTLSGTIYSAYCINGGAARLAIGNNIIYLKAGKNKLVLNFSSSGNVLLSDIVATTDYTVVAQPKAVYDEATKTLTFCSSDVLPAGSEDMAYTVPEVLDQDMLSSWCDYKDVIEKVVFDKSFKGFKPKSCAQWFGTMENLREITGWENLDLSEVISMRHMFSGCSSLEMLDLSSFNTAKVKDMSSMFDACSSLNTIYAGDAFSTENVQSSAYMFYACYSLSGAISYDTEKTDKAYANYTAGYFTKPCSHIGENGESALTKTGDVAATCVLPAYSVYHCSKCDKDLKTYAGEADPAGHAYEKTQDAVEASCSIEGSKEMYGCHLCYSYFVKDADGNYMEVSSSEDAATPPLGHEFSDGYKCSRCGETDLRYGALQLAGGIKAVIADSGSPWQIVGESSERTLGSTNKGINYSESTMTLYLTGDKPFGVNFRYKVSSEANADMLVLLKDGDEYASYSGEQTDVFTASFAAGTHTLKLRYRKDSSFDQGDDMATISEFSAAPVENYEEMPQAVAVYNKTDNSVTYKALASGASLGEDETVLGTIAIDNAAYQPNWDDALYTVSSIKIDKSFSQFRPKSTAMMFAYAGKVKEIEGLENLNTSETENMVGMFYGCYNLQKLDLSHFNTEKVKNFIYMFALCPSLTELDLTSFSTESAQAAIYMFGECYALENIYVNKAFSLENTELDGRSGIFYNCFYLSGAKPYSVLDDPLLAANYRDGYLKTYYKVGDERHDLFGDMTVDELNLVEGKAFMTHDAFHARKASLPVVISDDANAYNIGTICLPYALKAADGYTLYAVKQVSGEELAESDIRRSASDATAGTLVLETVEGTLPAGQPAVFKANGNTVNFAAADADIVENPASDDVLARDGYMMSGAFTEYEAADGYVHQGNCFVSVASLKGDSETYAMRPLTAYLKALPGAALSAGRLNVVSTDGVLSGLSSVKALSEGAAEIYDTNGVRLDTFKKGVNIIRRADGTTQKVVVR